MFQIEYKTGEGILYIEFAEEVGIYEFLSCVRSIGENSSLSKDICVLLDFGNAFFIFKPVEIVLVRNEFMKLAVKNNTLKVASVYSNPRETAYGQLLADNTSIKNYQHAVFHSRIAALSWLKPVGVKV